jgi:hypothetical protein
MRFSFVRGKRFQASVFGITFLFLLANPSRAALITDLSDDFLPSYTGPQNGDLDILNAQAFFNGSVFTFTATMNGLIGATAGTTYVWGINRGAGTMGFPAIASGVTFDAVFLLNPSGPSTLRDLISGISTPITDVFFSGSTITGAVALSLLPAEGFAPSNYLVNLWSRSIGSGNAVISDFAPNNSDAGVTVTPEPAGLTLVSGTLLMGLALIRRRKAAHSRLAFPSKL